MSTRLGVGIFCSLMIGCSWDYHADAVADVGAQDAVFDSSLAEVDVGEATVDTAEVCPGAMCGGKCLDTNKDPNNCGSCGKACATDEACVLGKCTRCPTGRIRCGTECIDTSTDNANCGACDTPCGPSSKCMASTCVCDAGTTKCAGKCVDTNTDATNCGACGNACAKGWGCFSGKCEEICVAPITKCSGVCVDTSIDPANCGACGTKCISAEDCVASACTCKTGLTRCTVDCVDTSIDPSNCGSCGNKCISAESCTAGACVCKGGLTKCGGACVDTTTDKTNCGGCGTTCGTSELCTAGVCKPFITYTQSFTSGGTPSTQCTAWNTFRTSISASTIYSKITMKGSLDANGVSGAGASANTLCQALRTGLATAAITCGTRFWRVGACGAGVELNANNNMCACSVGYTVRPCIGNLNWGGINSNSCSAPTQTMTVTCE